MTAPLKVPMRAWVAARYAPPVPDRPRTWRKWIAKGEIHPAPELVGNEYYVLETAVRVGVPAPEYIPLAQRV